MSGKSLRAVLLALLATSLPTPAVAAEPPTRNRVYRSGTSGGEDPSQVFERGLAFHQFALPGPLASHARIRLLERDGKWLYEWGEGWVLDERGLERARSWDSRPGNGRGSAGGPPREP